MVRWSGGPWWWKIHVTRNNSFNRNSSFHNWEMCECYKIGHFGELVYNSQYGVVALDSCSSIIKSRAMCDQGQEEVADGIRMLKGLLWGGLFEHRCCST